MLAEAISNKQKELLDISPEHLLNYDWDNWRNNKTKQALEASYRIWMIL